MKFHVEHVIPGIAPEDYEKLYFDEPFGIALCKEVRLLRTLEKLERDEKRVVRHVTCEPEGRQIPAPVAKILGGARIAYTEELSYTWGSFHGTWRTVASLLTDKVSSHGTVDFVRVPEGTKRVVDGEVEVRLFGVGGVVERFIVADVEKSYADAAEFTNRWLRERGRGG
ncbi:MAG: DUF2505 domain-containing protein [Polyangiales bacterium]